MSDESKPAPPAPEAPRPARRPYRRPELTEYGSVAKLTQSGGSTLTESVVPVMRMQVCL